MKTLLASILILMVGFTCSAQTKFICKNGYIGFYSHTPMEDIKGDNNQVASILNTENGEVIINVLMKSFKFDRALMEEHFNENYVESDKYPKSTFKGKITNLSAIDFKKDGIYNVDIEGNMLIHGATNPVKTQGTLEIKEGKITAKSKFQLDPKEYKIDIPSVVKEKFADKMDITVNAVYAPFEKQ
jgi:polyisoprenoid-binding protein YceI